MIRHKKSEGRASPRKKADGKATKKIDKVAAKKARKAKQAELRAKKQKRQPKVEAETEITDQGASFRGKMAAIYAGQVDKVDKELQLNTNLAKQPRMSSGLLALDLVLGRGLVPGFHIYFGAEASAKSTAAMTTLGSSLKVDIPFRKYFDAEGAVDRKYTGNILRTDDFTNVFGQQGPNGWIKPPLCRYHDSNIIETVFRSIHRSTMFMPDKVFREDDGCWYLVFGRTKQETALLKALGLEKNINRKLFTQTGRYWCNIGDDDTPQGVVMLDSLPALVPKDIDEEEISNRGRAIEARALGPMVKLVRGKLRPKGIIFLAVNQLRSNPDSSPGAMPFYEPGGNVLKFSSDTRNMWTSRVPQDGFPRHTENKGLCAEPSVEVEGGIDLYAFKGITNYKNKLGEPFRKGMARVWIADANKTARGFDPVYDTYRFLDELDLIKGPIHDSRRRFKIAGIRQIADVEWTWLMFKTLILAEDYKSKPLLSKAREMGAPKFKIREHCHKMIASGEAEKLYAKARTKTKEKAVDLEADDGDDDE